MLDEFDLLARRAKQSLLYNLFDAMQAVNMQASVTTVFAKQSYWT